MLHIFFVLNVELRTFIHKLHETFLLSHLIKVSVKTYNMLSFNVFISYLFLIHLVDSFFKFPFNILTKPNKYLFSQPPKHPDHLSNPNNRVVIRLNGPNVNNALFRASLKKELTFFRGCSALYKEIALEKSEIIAEGKTEQLNRFLDWLASLGTDLSSRKPNFQGPTLVVHIENVEWKEYKGDLKGFNANSEAPQIRPEVINPDCTLEAKSMLGTDESV